MAGADQFVERISALQALVGEGTCRGSLVRDQVYAHYQHANLELRHPNGGQALYQEGPLYAGAAGYLQTIADAVLESGVDQAMAQVMEDFASDSAAVTPKELTLLAHSDHPTVTSNGVLVYDRPPEVPRMSDAELRALAPRRPSRGGDIDPFRRRSRRSR